MASSPDVVDNTKTVFTLLCDIFNQGSPLATKAAVAGIMGNIHVESAGSFSFTQKQIGGGNGYGLFQFDAMRKPYTDWLAKAGRSDSAESQIIFTHRAIQSDEIYDIGAGHRAALQKALKSGDVTLVTKEFLNRFERPNPEKAQYDRRLEYALKCFGAK